jgi:hypothetical protein
MFKYFNATIDSFCDESYSIAKCSFIHRAIFYLKNLKLNYAYDNKTDQSVTAEIRATPMA